MSGRGAVAALLVALAVVGCDRDRELQLPDAGVAAARYTAAASAEVRGNLLEVRVPIADEITRRGGAIWARGGPYLFLFSLSTRDILVEHPDLVAVRVITTTEDGTEIARALIRRDTFTESRWNEAMTRSALAQRDGTTRPRVMEELVAWGEQHTEHHYNPEFLAR